MGAVDRTRTILERGLAAVLLLAALPLIIVTAIVSFACYRAWPFFVQDRVGQGGQTFRFIKVRSLPPQTDRYADKYSIGISRIPAIMQTIRRLHLDELPQLVHVVRGQMSFVGPRPEMPNLHARLPRAFATERVSVRPGLTGLWQISPHCQNLIGERTEYDRLYIEHRTLALDGWILLRTLLKMTVGRVTHLHDVPTRVVRRVPIASSTTIVLVEPGSRQRTALATPSVPAGAPVLAAVGAGIAGD